MNRQRNPAHWLLASFQPLPGKPAIAYGLRVALGMSVPIALGLITGQLATGLLIAYAVLNVLFADVGGAYRQKAIALLAATIGVAVAVLLATLVDGISWLQVLTTFLWVFITALAGLYGNTAAAVGLPVALTFVITAGISEPASAFARFGLSLAGGAWAMLLSLGLWRLYVYKPVAKAVADCYLTLATFIESATAVALSPERRGQWPEGIVPEDAVIQRLEAARHTWAFVRGGRQGSSRRGLQLLVLLADADHITNSVVAVAELLEVASGYPMFESVQAEVQQALQQLEIAVRLLATAIRKVGDSVPLSELDRAIEALETKLQLLQTQTLSQSDDLPEWVSIRKIVVSIQLLARQLHSDAELVQQLKSGGAPDLQLPPLPQLKVWNRRSIMETLQANFTLRSVGLRHALRLGLTTAIAVYLSLLLHLPHGYWVALTVLMILKPDFGATSQRAVQRLVGTLLGSVLAISLAFLVQNQVMMLLCVSMLAFYSFAVLPLNYGMFVIGLTPLIILLINLGDVGNWQLGLVRILNTMLGGGLALVSGYLLFPSWERLRLSTQLADTIRANLAYFQSVIVTADAEKNPDSIRQARYQAELENANAAAAAQRLLNEPIRIRGEVEPVMTAVTYLHSLANSVTTLAEHLQGLSKQHQHPNLQMIANVTIHVLENLADALQERILPQPIPALDSALEPIHTYIQQLDRARLIAQAGHQSHPTLTAQAAPEDLLVAIELDRIMNSVIIIHRAIARLQADPNKATSTQPA